MEAGVGIEPAYTDLQSAAWPLCHPAMLLYSIVAARSADTDANCPYRTTKKGSRSASLTNTGAGNESRTRDLNLGKVALYQLSYSRANEREVYGRSTGGQSPKQHDKRARTSRRILAAASD